MFQVTLSIYTIYNSLFRPFVEYGIAPWGEKKSQMENISLLQNRAVRIIDNAKTASHTDPHFLSMKSLI